jgi:hypothetical protein
MCAGYKRLEHQNISPDSPHIGDHHQHIISSQDYKDLEELSTIIMKIIEDDQHSQFIKPPSVLLDEV